MRGLFVAAIASLACLAPNLPASAQNRIVIPCANGAPCVTSIGGHVDAFNRRPLPWIASVLVQGGLCFVVNDRLRDGPLLITVIAPDGTIYRNGSALIIKVAQDGWHTVQIDAKPPGVELIFVADFLLNTVENCANSFGTPGG